MLELLVLIAGVVLLYKFNASTRAIATGAETKTEVWAEEIVMEATLERADNYEQWKKQKEGKEIVTHEAFMAEMKGKTN